MVNEAPDGDDIEVELKVYRGASWKDIGTVTITDGTTQGSITFRYGNI